METKLSQARALFNIAHLQKEDCQKLIDFETENTDVLIQGYRIAAKIVYGKYIFNPVKLISIFNNGKGLLEDLLSENYGNVELHYIRYTIRCQAPKFLNYYRNKDSDRAILVEYIKENPSSDFTNHMMIYLKDTEDAIMSMI